MLHPSFKVQLPLVIETLKKYKIKSAFAFGSVVTKHFNAESDIDFLINFEDGLEPLERGELWWQLHDALRQSLNREIDLLNESALKNPYFIKEVNKTKIAIYG